MTVVQTRTRPEVRLLMACEETPETLLDHILGCQLYNRHIEMIEAVRDRSRVAVSSANGTGKDFAAARTIHWWQQTRYPAKTVVIGPTNRQVNNILWKEFRNARLCIQQGLVGDTRLKTDPCSKWRSRFGSEDQLVSHRLSNSRICPASSPIPNSVVLTAAQPGPSGSLPPAGHHHPTAGTTPPTSACRSRRRRPRLKRPVSAKRNRLAR